MQTQPQAQALVLAAGRGERMRPLTDTTPKPLLPVRGKPLMQWTLEALARAGVDTVLVNTAWLGGQIPGRFGERFQPPMAGRPVSLLYSNEGTDFGGALETAGGIVRALPRLAPVFWLAAGDVYAPEFAFAREDLERFEAGGRLAHLWLVPNPPHHPRGDFGMSEDGSALADPAPQMHRYTYSTIGLFRAEFFAPPRCDIPPGNPAGLHAPLAPMLRAAMARGQVSAQLYAGTWIDVGTPQRLAELNDDGPAQPT